MTTRTDTLNMSENIELVSKNKEMDLNLDPTLSFANLLPKKSAFEEEEEEDED